MTIVFFILRCLVKENTGVQFNLSKCYLWLERLLLWDAMGFSTANLAEDYAFHYSLNEEWVDGVNRGYFYRKISIEIIIYLFYFYQKFIKKENGSWIRERSTLSWENAPSTHPEMFTGYQLLNSISSPLIFSYFIQFFVIIRIYFPHSMSVFLGSL